MWNAVAYAYCDRNGDSHSYGGCHSVAYAYSYCDGYGYRNSHSHRDAHGDTLHVACSSERTNRNQYNFWQLYRALEQRKRRDRLSVGRIHNQPFHHLRTGLSGFGRRKRDQLPRDRVKCEHDLLLPSASLQWVCYKQQFQRQKCTDVALRSDGEQDYTYSL